jgi:hypothetical protein
MMSIRRSAWSLLAGLLFVVMARPAVAHHSPEPDPNFGGTYLPPVQDPVTGHWYQVALAVTAVTWDVARVAAESQTLNGYPGHLATITSAAENDFVLQTVFPHSPWLYFPLWLGAYQEKGTSDYLEPGGGWRWVTGEPWGYTAWLSGQPDNRIFYSGDSDALAFRNKLGWDGLPYASFTGDGAAGFLVEYEPAPPVTGLPSLPHPPGNLTATLASLTQINLRWEDRSDNEEGFEVFRLLPNDYWLLIARLPSNTTAFVDTTVAPLTTYIYRVRAYNRRGPSAWWSNYAWADTAIPPSSPTGLAVTQAGSNFVTLTWTDRSSDERGFDIQRQAVGGDWMKIGVAAANSGRYTDRSAGVKAGLTLHYRVRAHNNSGASAWSNEVTAVTH